VLSESEHRPQSAIAPPDDSQFRRSASLEAETHLRKIFFERRGCHDAIA
jgi:hypothetical protein